MSDFEKLVKKQEDEDDKKQDLDPIIETEMEEEDEKKEEADEETGSASLLSTVAESAAKDESEIQIETIGSLPDVYNAAKLERDEISYPDVVPSSQILYRTGLEGILSKTGKSSKGEKATNVIGALGELNDLLGQGITQGSFGAAIKGKNITDIGVADKALEEVEAAYDKVVNMTQPYFSRKVVWTKAGRKRRQVMKGLRKYLLWEKKIIREQTTALLGKRVLPEVMEHYTLGNLIEPSAMLNESAALAVQKLKNTISSGIDDNGERTFEANVNRADSIRSSYKNVANSTGGSMNSRLISDAIMGMGILAGDSPQRSYQAAKNLDYSNDGEYAQNRVERIREIERMFETILQFDVNEYKLNSFEDLKNPEKLKGVIMSYMAWDSETFFDDYKNWLADPGMREKLALDEDMFQEVNAIRDASGGLQGLLTEVTPFFKDPIIQKYVSIKELDKLTTESCQEKFAKAQEMKDPDEKSTLSNFYLKMMSYVTEEAGILPGGNPQAMLQEKRKNRKVDGSKVSAAIDAIRRKRSSH